MTHRPLTVFRTAMELRRGRHGTALRRGPRATAAGVLLTVVSMITAVGCAQEPVATSTGSSSFSAPLPVPNLAASSEIVSPTPEMSDPGPAPVPVETADPPVTSTSLLPAMPMGSSRPARLQVPALGADAPLLDLGLQADGTLEVPPDASSVGWFTGGPTPGELGPAVIVGHVDWAGEPGIFYDLRDLRPDDDITVTREDGSIAHFVVRSTEQFAKAEFPTAAVYGNIDRAGLRLITCGGSFDESARSYQDNIIVFADLVEAGPH